MLFYTPLDQVLFAFFQKNIDLENKSGLAHLLGSSFSVTHSLERAFSLRG
jgi:hypothetical protein